MAGLEAEAREMAVLQVLAGKESVEEAAQREHESDIHSATNSYPYFC